MCWILPDLHKPRHAERSLNAWAILIPKEGICYDTILLEFDSDDFLDYIL